MAKKTTMKVWYDREGDYLELSVSRKKGYFKDVGNDIWERIDQRGRIIGFAIANFTKRLANKQAEVELPMEIAFHG